MLLQRKPIQSWASTLVAGLRRILQLARSGLLFRSRPPRTLLSTSLQLLFQGSSPPPQDVTLRSGITPVRYLHVHVIGARRYRAA